MINHFENIIKKLKLLESFRSMMDAFEMIDDLELYVAGGVVRNYFIDDQLAIKDVDLFYKGNIKSLLEKIKHKGKLEFGPFGSLRWMPFNNPIYYDIISIELFDNGVEKCRTITDVLNQFDFTANCLAFSLNNGSFFNPCDGLNDIKMKTIKLVRYDYPNEIISNHVSISRTSILWFRILHYSFKLHFQIDPNTKKWVVEYRTSYDDLNKFQKYFFNPTIDEKILWELNIYE